MNLTFQKLPYSETGYFSNIVTAYIGNDERLKPFYKYPVSPEGLDVAIAARQQFQQNRELLVQELRSQYAGLQLSAPVEKNIDLLSQPNTYTVCTAHQPAIFTGNLFFIYKILHAIRLAEHLKELRPNDNFVPVFYMGSEDADLDELGNIFLNGEKIIWETNQQGAVGRMNTKGLDKLIHRISGELSVLPFGNELVELLRKCYLESNNIQTATLKLVNHLFAEYGLVVVIPDNAGFKRAMIPVFEDELFNQVSSPLVEETNKKISANFKVQAHPRDINLFYLKDNIRQRIERDGDQFKVVNTEVVFTGDQIKDELNNYPERFSPNVILRGLLQETILPNIAFIGGGGELAYWMQLKAVFEHYKVPYPVLIVRNSFLVIEEKWKEKLDKLQISIPEIFKPKEEIFKSFVKKESEKQLNLKEEISEVSSYYHKMKMLAGMVDDTLTGHVEALQTRAIKPLHELEKKLLRAEKRKFAVQERQLTAVKETLFPNNSLQERVENFMPYYAKWGKGFISIIYQNSLPLDQVFSTIIVAD